MHHFPYVGSGPYCYANAFAMMFGAASPSTAVIEFATCSPFGMQLIGGRQPFFDPYGWTPEASFEEALTAMGWTSTQVNGTDADDALLRLEKALEAGPVWIGPVEMGHLRHQPGMNGPIGADHYVVVLGIGNDGVLMHDPHGFPHACLPLDDFIKAWRAETIDYGSGFTLRTEFRRLREVTEEEIIEASMPAAIRWLSMAAAPGMPDGSLGNGDAAERLADMVEAGGDEELLGGLSYFAVRVGARRAADAADGLARIGREQAAAIMARQAQLIGGLQYPLVVGDLGKAAAGLRLLAPTYAELSAALGG